MKLRLALYDPSHYDSEGSNWTWKNPEIPGSVLDRFFYDVAGKRRPSHPNNLKPDTLHAGLSRMENGWSVVYRFCNGGRDRHGRPDRFVIACGWFITGEARALDIAQLLRSTTFAQIVNIAPASCPMPPPSSLILEWPDAVETDPDPDDMKRLLASGNITMTGEDALAKASVSFFSIPPGKPVHIYILDNGETQQAEILFQGSEMTKAITPKSGLHPYRQAPAVKTKRPESGKQRSRFATFLTTGPATFAAGVFLGLILAVALGWRPDWKSLPFIGTAPLVAPSSGNNRNDDRGNDYNALKDESDDSNTFRNSQETGLLD